MVKRSLRLLHVVPNVSSETEAARPGYADGPQRMAGRCAWWTRKEQPAPLNLPSAFSEICADAH